MLALTATCYNLVSICLLSVALYLVKRWLDVEFTGLRQWKCSVEGLFLFYLLLFALLLCTEIALLYFILAINKSEFTQRMRLQYTTLDDNFYNFFIGLMVYTVVNFAMMLF